MSAVVEVLCVATILYIIAMFLRIILSWFPVSADSPVAVVSRVLLKVTEPVLAPVRRLLPPVRIGAGALDLSPIIVLFTLQLVVRDILLRCN